MKVDLSGKTFGSFYVISFSHIRLSKQYLWKCKCLDCLEERLVESYDLKKERRPCSTCTKNKKSNNRIEDVKKHLLSFVVISENGCWEWNGFKDKYGYGICWKGYHNQHAHRTFFYLFNGEFDIQKWVLHKCDNRKCVNPDHLYLGDVRQNVKDSLERGSFPRGPNIKKGSKGVKNPNSKLTENQVREIRNEYTHKRISSNFLSKKYGINRTQIINIVKWRCWKCVL